MYITFLLIILSLWASSQDIHSREYKVKATFLFNFTKFVEWPPSSFDSAEAPFIIAILGSDPFGSLIDEVVAGEKVKGRPIIVQRQSLPQEIGHCHLLFINVKEASSLNKIMTEIPPRILTISDDPNFNTAGGMIRLVTENNRIKLVINPIAVKAAELSISSKLLNVSEIFTVKK